MVAEERRRAADLEAQLRESASERHALGLVVKILEEENQQFRDILASASQVVRQAKTTSPADRHTPSPSRNHSRNSSRSSLSVPNAAGSAPGSPHANPKHPTLVGSVPSVGNETETPTNVDLAWREETVKLQPATWSTPPPPEVDCWPDSHTAPPEAAEPDEGEATERLAIQ